MYSHRLHYDSTHQIVISLSFLSKRQWEETASVENHLANQSVENQLVDKVLIQYL